MKKGLLFVTAAVIVCLLAALLPSLGLDYSWGEILEGIDTTQIDYSLHSENFEKIIGKDDSIDISKLSIAKSVNNEIELIPVTEDMITYMDSSDSIGYKKLIVEYLGEEYVLHYEVRYRVTLSVDGKVVDSQLVKDPSDIVLPSANDTVKDNWNILIPDDITGNFMIDAPSESIVAPLYRISATYGDSLADIKLPSNEYGSWVLDDPSGTVGGAGYREFAATFIWSDISKESRAGIIALDVAKRRVEFTDTVTSFVYDGNAHFPTYNVPDGLSVTEIGNAEITEAGSYDFMLIIDDENHEGELSGSFTIDKAQITVTVVNADLIYGSTASFVPEYTVEGFDNVAILGISVTLPEELNAGSYSIGATSSNQNVTLTVNPGTLTIGKATFDPGLPTLSSGTAAFEDKLSSITFEHHPGGVWKWASPDSEVGAVGEKKFSAIFTPNNENYYEHTTDVSITVEKKTLYFEVKNTAFVYNSSEKTLEYTLKDANGKVYDGLSVTGNTPYTAAGIYDIDLRLSDSSYKGSISVKMTIAKAMPDADFSFISRDVWRPGIKLSDIALPTGYTWVDPDSAVSYAGASSYSAIYTPTDTSNYETEIGILSIELEKATATIGGVLDSYTFTYNRSEHTLYGITASHKESELEYSIIKNGASSTILGAGSYSVTVILPETVNYKAAEATTTVTVLKAENKDTLAVTQSATYGDLISVISLPVSEDGVWSLKEAVTTVGAAGTRTYTAVFTPYTENYASREVTLTVNVAKKAVNAPIVSNKTYTGGILYSGLTDTDLYIITSDIGGSAEGEYSVTVKLADTENYTWSSTSADSVTVKYTIAKAVNNWITPPTIDGWIWGEAANTGFAEAEFGGVLIEYRQDAEGAEFSTEVPSTAGKYIARFTSTDSIHSQLLVEIPFTVSKKQIAVPTLSGDGPVYTSAHLNSGLSATDDYTVTDAGGIDAGNYEITLTLKDALNTEWADGTSGSTKTIAYSIRQAEAQFESITVEGWTWGESGTISASASFGASVIFTFSTEENGTYTEGSPTEPGNYFVKALIEGSNNYYGMSSSPIPFTIAKITPTVTAPIYPDGALYLNAVSLESDYVTAPTASIEGSFSYGSISFAHGSSTFTLTFTPTDSAHYNTVSVTAAVVLKTVATVYDSSLATAKSYHGTIEAAIGAAASGDIVLVTPDITGELYITENVSIASGVTLILPYGEHSTNLADVYNQKSGGHYKATLYGKTVETTAETCVTLVTVKAGVTVTNNGTIIIAGILTGGNAGYECGVTAGEHARLVLEADSALVLNNGSQTDCLGYIVDSAENGSGSVTVKDGATLLQPFAFYDFRGGSFMYAVYSKQSSYRYCPFSEYLMKNVESLITIESDGLLQAVINLYAGDQQNATTSNMIGNVSSASLIQLTTENSYVTSKYSPEDQRVDLDIYGGAQTGSMKINVKALLTSVSINTSDYFFPISHYYDISLNTLPGESSASYTMSQSFIFRGGLVFTIGEGVTLTANEIAIWDEADIPELTYGARDYLNQGEAIFIVNGTLIVNKIGGKIRTEVDGATVTIKNSASLVTYVAYGADAISGSSILASLNKVHTASQDTMLVYGNTLYAKVGTAVSEGGKWPVITTAISIAGEGFDFTVTGNIYDADGNIIATSYDSRTEERRSEFFVDEGAVVNFIGLPASLGVFINGSLINPLGAGSIYEGGDVEWIVSNGDTCEVKTIAVISSITNSASASVTVTYNSDGTVTVAASKKGSAFSNCSLNINASVSGKSDSDSGWGLSGYTATVEITIPAGVENETVTITT